MAKRFALAGAIVLVVGLVMVADFRSREAAAQQAQPAQRWEYASLSKSVVSGGSYWVLVEPKETLSGTDAEMSKKFGNNPPLKANESYDEIPILNQMGNRGWEFMVITNSGRYLFKRPAH